jgi:histidinol-phosphate/aromatic aminotransferase/cobyric acid decarboxylase-like protein
VVVVVNPNNPTGTTLPSTVILDMVHAHTDVDFLVDESFIDFSTQPSVLDCLAAPATMATAPPNLIVLKSLSKCWGIPGLRLGYTWSSSPSWNARLDDELPIWNINSLAERVIELVLKHRDALQHSFATSRADRDAMQVMLSTVPGVRRVVDSGGNFAVVELESAAAAARATQRLLAEHGVWVKDVSSKLGGGWLRLAVRTSVENQRLASLLGRVLTAP